MTTGTYGLHRTREGMVEAVHKCLAALPALDTFDTIYVTGQSGIVPGSIVAYELGKSLVILRKGGERSHGLLLEGGLDLAREGVERRVLIIDDFLCTGNTMARLLKRLRGTLVGVVLYGQPATIWEREHGYIQPTGLLRMKRLLRRVSDTNLWNLEVTK